MSDEIKIENEVSDEVEELNEVGLNSKIYCADGCRKIKPSDEQIFKEYGTTSNVSFLTIGDGVVSNGILEGQDQNPIQLGVDILDGYGGGTLFIKEGNYTFTSALSTKDNVRLVGLGGANITKPASGPAIELVSSHVSIDGINFKGTGSNNDAIINLYSSADYDIISDITIKNCNFDTNSDAYAIGIAPQHNNISYENIKIYDNLFTSTDDM